uniref:Cnidarian restricted protein n=1 Tax=Clytia hemisphaerica TaxID=252671 RepID=A0A7M5V4W2_9CNID
MKIFALLLVALVAFVCAEEAVNDVNDVSNDIDLAEEIASDFTLKEEHAVEDEDEENESEQEEEQDQNDEEDQSNDEIAEDEEKRGLNGPAKAALLKAGLFKGGYLGFGYPGFGYPGFGYPGFGNPGFGNPGFGNPYYGNGFGYPYFPYYYRPNLIRGRVIARRAALPLGWRVSVQIRPLGIVNGFSSILHASIGGNKKNYGDRVPAIFFRPKSTRLHICSAVNGHPNYCFDSHPIPRNRYTNVVIQQVEKPNYGNLYFYQIFINGRKVRDVLNTKPQVFRNVQYFASNPFYQPAIANIRNFRLTNTPKRPITALVKSTVIQKVPVLPSTWRVTFQLRPYAAVSGDSSILHASIGATQRITVIETLLFSSFREQLD